MTQCSETKTENLENDFIELSTKTQELGWSDDKDNSRDWIQKGIKSPRNLFARENMWSREGVKAVMAFHQFLKRFLFDLFFFEPQVHG